MRTAGNKYINMSVAINYTNATNNNVDNDNDNDTDINNKSNESY